MQITKEYDKDLISEISLKCGDEDFKDFDKNIYAQAVFRGQREIAKRYKILQKKIEFTIYDEDIHNGQVKLPTPNFQGSEKLTINGEAYEKSRDIDDTIKQYRIETDLDGVWWIEYTNPQDGDVIWMLYTSIGFDASEVDGTPVLPRKFYEETIKESILYLAQIGIAKFRDEKLEKYTRLFQLYGDKDTDFDLEADRGWVQIKPFQYP